MPLCVIQSSNAMFAVGWSLPWTELNDVVHRLFWIAAVTRGGVSQTPASDGRSEAAYANSEAVKHCPLTVGVAGLRPAARLVPPQTCV